MAAPDAEDHHGSHRDLIIAHSDKPSMPLPDGQVDAIIVPTIRPAWYLQQAAWLAHWHSCPLVTLHSQHLPFALQAEAGPRRTSHSNAQQTIRFLHTDIDLISIDVPYKSFLRLPPMKTTEMLAGTRFERRADTSAKRNIGLILSKLAGWQRIVFLDDDIRVPVAADLTRAAALLDNRDGVGLHIGGFPDNSVVCHANRETGDKGGHRHLFPARFKRSLYLPHLGAVRQDDDHFWVFLSLEDHRVAVSGFD